MPGKRIKAGHIDELPPASKVGPYRNIVIHTGINNINNNRYRQSNQSLIGNLESKIHSYSQMYPKSKIFVSLLLPSRLRTLNRRITDFNNLLLDMTCRIDRVSIIENGIFGDILTNDHGRWKSSGSESNEFEPNLNDVLHLGKKGIRLFAISIKDSIIKKRPQSCERHDAGRGQYRDALVRGTDNHDS